MIPNLILKRNAKLNILSRSYNNVTTHIRELVTYWIVKH